MKAAVKLAHRSPAVGNVRLAQSVIWTVTHRDVKMHERVSPIPVLTLVINCFMSVLGCMATLTLIPAFKEHFISARLYGLDMNKTVKKEV